MYSTGSNRNSNSVPVRRRSQGVLTRSGRGTIASIKEGVSIGAVDKLQSNANFKKYL